MKEESIRELLKIRSAIDSVLEQHDVCHLCNEQADRWCDSCGRRHCSEHESDIYEDANCCTECAVEIREQPERCPSCGSYKKESRWVTYVRIKGHLCRDKWHGLMDNPPERAWESGMTLRHRETKEMIQLEQLQSADEDFATWQYRLLAVDVICTGILHFDRWEVVEQQPEFPDCVCGHPFCVHGTSFQLGANSCAVGLNTDFPCDCKEYRAPEKPAQKWKPKVGENAEFADGSRFTIKSVTDREGKEFLESESGQIYEAEGCRPVPPPEDVPQPQPEKEWVPKVGGFFESVGKIWPITKIVGDNIYSNEYVIPKRAAKPVPPPEDVHQAICLLDPRRIIIFEPGDWAFHSLSGAWKKVVEIRNDFGGPRLVMENGEEFNAVECYHTDLDGRKHV